jgi:hypothetical protein
MSPKAVPVFPPSTGPLAAVTRPIAVVLLEPEQLSSKGLRFRIAHDDLDVLDWAEIVGASGSRYALVRHRQAPQPGTQIVISSEAREPRAALLEVLQRLDVQESDLLWVHPDVKMRIMRSRRPAGSARSRTGRVPRRGARIK